MQVSGIDTGLWGGMLSAMSVVVGFQLFFIQNWLSACSELENEARLLLSSKDLGDPDLGEMVKNMEAQMDRYPKQTTLVMSLTVVLFCVLSVVVGVQLEGIPVILTVTPGIALLAAFLVVAVVSWRQATKKINIRIQELEDPGQPVPSGSG